MQRGTREYALWSIGILLILTFSIFPVLWIVSVSLKDPATITEGTNFGNTFIPQDITFDNYDALFQGGISESPFIRPLINSILIGLISTVIAIVLAAFAAYAIARLDFPGWPSRSSRRSRRSGRCSTCGAPSASTTPTRD